MPRLQIHLRGNPGGSRTRKLLGLAFIGVVLVCVVLLVVGLWIFLAIGMVALAVVGLVRALLPWGQARKPTSEAPAIIEGESTTLGGADGVDAKEGALPPPLDRAP